MGVLPLDTSVNGECEITQGIQGYDKNIESFIELSQSLPFEQVCKEFIPFLPDLPCNALDIGSGAGQNSKALAELGFNVTAVEPMLEFVQAARKSYKHKPINWMQGSLPELNCLQSCTEQFGFVLIEGVWHHLDHPERERAVERISSCTSLNGRCAISMRNGPAGMGERVIPINTASTIDLFERHHFECVYLSENIDSILPNKENVKWARAVFRKY